MKLELAPDAARLYERAAQHIAVEAERAVAARGRCLLALSGGRTPAAMFAVLRELPLPWDAIHLLQVDERAAPDGDPARNLVTLETELVRPLGLDRERVHAMPVTTPDLQQAARRYSRELVSLAGDPPVLDLVHLGLGDDGHTASLVPGDAALGVDDAWVAATGPYRGHRRLTLTFPTLAAASTLLWLVTGADKREALRLLFAGDSSIPAGRVESARAVLFADAAAVDG